MLELCRSMSAWRAASAYGPTDVRCMSSILCSNQFINPTRYNQNNAKAIYLTSSIPSEN